MRKTRSGPDFFLDFFLFFCAVSFGISTTDLAKEIMADFPEDIPRQIARPKELMGRSDVGLAGEQGHAIKGAAANVGGMALSAVAAELEKIGGAGQLEEMAALIPELERQFDLLKAGMLAGAS